MKRFVIIDGNSLLFRAFFAMREMVTRDGIYTQGVFAFINMLNKILEDYHPDYIAVAFDMKAPTFRHEAYPEYKAGRLKTPMELLSQIPLMQEVLQAMNITVLEKEGFEADDLIGTMTAKAAEEGLESLIITGDKDALQLVGKNTYVVLNRKGMTDFDLYDLEKMQERYGLTPQEFIDLKGLMGDKSDNIPGIPGVGEKKGINLLKEYGSVEGVVAHADEIKGKLGENVRANLEEAELSKWLATIKRDVELPVSWPDLAYGEPDYDRLIALYKKLEFKKFLQNLEKQTPDEVTVEPEKDLLEGVREVSYEDLLDSLKNNRTLIIEMDTDDNHKQLPEVKGIRLYDPEQMCYAECTVTPLDFEIRIQNSVNPFLVVAGGADNLAVPDFKSDIFKGEALFLRRSIIGNHTVHRILYRCGIHLAIRNIALPGTLHRRNIFNGECHIRSRCHDSHLIRLIHPFLQRVHGTIHFGLIQGAHVIIEFLKSLLTPVHALRHRRCRISQDYPLGVVHSFIQAGRRVFFVQVVFLRRHIAELRRIGRRPNPDIGIHLFHQVQIRIILQLHLLFAASHQEFTGYNRMIALHKRNSRCSVDLPYNSFYQRNALLSGVID